MLTMTATGCVVTTDDYHNNDDPMRLMCRALLRHNFLLLMALEPQMFVEAMFVEEKRQKDKWLYFHACTGSPSLSQ